MTTLTRRRAGLSLVETLVVIGIIGVLIALTLPAVQKVRSSAGRATCANNLRQLVAACHQADQAYGVMPPGIGYYPNANSGAYGNGFFHLLPWLEQENLFASAAAGTVQYPGINNVFARPVKVFLCPADPTTGSHGVVPDDFGVSWGACSYAGNAQVFCQVDKDGQFLRPDARPCLAVSFPDGTSQTILFAEKYARCRGFDYPRGGQLLGVLGDRRHGPAAAPGLRRFLGDVQLRPRLALPGAAGPRQLRPDVDLDSAPLGHAGGPGRRQRARPGADYFGPDVVGGVHAEGRRGAGR
jgi:hypothetical protein